MVKPRRTVVQGTHRQTPAAWNLRQHPPNSTEAITTWATHWNLDPKPFIWKATADDIIAKVRRGRATLHQIKSQTDH